MMILKQKQMLHLVVWVLLNVFCGVMMLMFGCENGNADAVTAQQSQAYQLVDPKTAVVYRQWPQFDTMGHVQSHGQTWPVKQLVAADDAIETKNLYRVDRTKSRLVRVAAHQSYWVKFVHIVRIDGKLQGWVRADQLTSYVLVDDLTSFSKTMIVQLKPKYRSGRHFYRQPQGLTKQSLKPLALSKRLNRLHFTLQAGLNRELEGDNWYQIKSRNAQLNGQWVSGGVIQTVHVHQDAGISEF